MINVNRKVSRLISMDLRDNSDFKLQTTMQKFVGNVQVVMNCQKSQPFNDE